MAHIPVPGPGQAQQPSSSTVFLRSHHATGRNPCVPSLLPPSFLSPFKSRRGPKGSPALGHPGRSQGLARAGRGTPSTARIRQPRPAPMPHRTPRSQWAAAPASLKPGGSWARSSPAGHGERDQRAGPAAPSPREGHGGRGRCRQSIGVHGVNPSPTATRAAWAVPPQLRTIHSSCSPRSLLFSGHREPPPTPCPSLPACLLSSAAEAV